jgi:hypothetical protein
MIQGNQGAICLMVRGEDQCITEVLEDNTITIQGIQLGECAIVQVLSRNLGRLGWMNCEGK